MYHLYVWGMVMFFFLALSIDVIFLDIVVLAVVWCYCLSSYSQSCVIGHSAFGWFLLFFQCQRSKSSSNIMPQKMLSPSFTLISFIPVVLSAPIVFVAFQATVSTRLRG